MLLWYSFPAWSATVNVSGLDIDFSNSADGQNISKAIQVLILMTVLSLAPALMIMVTGFTRIIIVLAMLRHAFGMPSTPPNIVLISLALFLTLFTMLPVVQQIEDQAYKPLVANKISGEQALERASVPLQNFMLLQTREKDLKLMFGLSGKSLPQAEKDVPMTVLIPAFLISELQTAFQIGFVIFLPFLLIDLICASVLMSMGMIMVPPMTISLPIKILMFVLIEGWTLIAQALVGSFHLL